MDQKSSTFSLVVNEDAFKFRPGSFVAVCGCSGSGKTAKLLEILTNRKRYFQKPIPEKFFIFYTWWEKGFEELEDLKATEADFNVEFIENHESEFLLEKLL